MADPQQTSQSPFSKTFDRAKFGRSKSNGTSVYGFQNLTVPVPRGRGAQTIYFSI